MPILSTWYITKYSNGDSQYELPLIEGNCNIRCKVSAK